MWYMSEGIIHLECAAWKDIFRLKRHVAFYLNNTLRVLKLKILYLYIKELTWKVGFSLTSKIIKVILRTDGKLSIRVVINK